MKKSAERFFEKVVIGRPNECWKWTGAMTPSGYGLAWWCGKVVSAHRVAYVLKSGPIPPGLVVRHLCGRKECVNPAHLALGTSADNMRDQILAGRRASFAGELNSQHKLTERQVHLIRGMVMFSAWSRREVAQIFGVSVPQICYIANHLAWRHI